MPARAAGLERVLTWAGEPVNTEADGLMNRRGKLDAIAVNGPADVALDWDAIDWRFHEHNVIRLRRRIFTATREQDWASVRSLQKLMLGSWSNTLVSVRQVTRRNAGRRTAGIDGEVACPRRSGRMWRGVCTAVAEAGIRCRSGACTFPRPTASSARWAFRRRRHSHRSPSDDLGFVVVTHPFHPLRGQRLEVLFVKRRGTDMVFVCAGTAGGQVTLVRGPTAANRRWRIGCRCRAWLSWRWRHALSVVVDCRDWSRHTFV